MEAPSKVILVVLLANMGMWSLRTRAGTGEAGRLPENEVSRARSVA
jgi:hypothetical protein